MRIELDPLEARVIGCLVEKQITTPDQYPLSLNSLASACNQKSNRDPVMSVDEATLQRTLDALSRKHLVLERSGFGSRVPKYQHLFCNTEYGSLKLSAQELAIVCELLLRGPQTPGELRSRANRMASFTDVSEVEAALQSLLQRESGPLVARLAREPGRRESRYMHLFSGEPPPQAVAKETAAEDARLGTCGESRMVAVPFKPKVYVKEGCPFSFKFLLFVTEAGIADQLKVIRCNPEASGFEAIKAKLEAGLHKSATFPTVEIEPNRYLSDALIDHFVSKRNIEVNRLPVLSFYLQTILPQLIRLHEGHGT
jgi:uncharacterized protein YceH (UPF0502 family)